MSGVSKRKPSSAKAGRGKGQKSGIASQEPSTAPSCIGNILAMDAEDAVSSPTIEDLYQRDHAISDDFNLPVGRRSLVDDVTSPLPYAGPRIDIRLDRALTAGWIRNRHDIVMRGLIVAERPVEAVALVLNGDVRALSLYDRTAGTQQVFCLTLAQRKDLKPEQVSLKSRPERKTATSAGLRS